MAGGGLVVSAAALVGRKSWEWAAISLGRAALLSRRIERTPWRFPVCRWKTNYSFLSRPDLPKLAYKKVKGKTPGIVFLPSFQSNMNGVKALAIEDFCKSLGHAFIRFLRNKPFIISYDAIVFHHIHTSKLVQHFPVIQHPPIPKISNSFRPQKVLFDYSGCGNSDGNFEECTVGKWRKDVLSIIDGLTEGPQILVGSSLGGWLMLHAAIARPEKVAALIGIATAADSVVTQFNYLSVQAKKDIEVKGIWKVPTKYSEDGFYTIQYNLIKEAKLHCLLHGPIPVTCPVRLLHGMKDEVIPWQTSMQVADRVISTDVDIILRKNSDHRMKEKEDIKLLVYTIDDLIDKLTTSN